MEFEKLKEFIEFMDNNNLCELEIEEEGKRVKLKKNSSGQPVVVSQAQGTPTEEEEEKKEGTIEIKAPMVGAFYRAASPGAKPYVDVDDVIKPGDVVCIVEAMKLMNEIKADVGGRITKIPVDNGEPIEFGQTLFVIEPA